MGNVSTVGFAVGGAATITGVVLLGLLLADAGKSGAGGDEKRALVPLIGPGFLGVGGRY